MALRLRITARAAAQIERAGLVIYRVKDEELVVLSVWHTSRGTGPRL